MNNRSIGLQRQWLAATCYLSLFLKQIAQADLIILSASNITELLSCLMSFKIGSTNQTNRLIWSSACNYDFITGMKTFNCFTRHLFYI